jgi:hypothetical protein
MAVGGTRINADFQARSVFDQLGTHSAELAGNPFQVQPRIEHARTLLGNTARQIDIPDQRTSPDRH